MPVEAERVRSFSERLWNRHDRSAIPELLHERLRFRGSLGEEITGHAGFGAYLDRVHRALGDDRGIIEEMACEPPRLFARMTFGGIRRGALLGYSPIGRRVHWAGAARFLFEGGRIRDLWVLGDFRDLEAQLQGG